MLSGTRLIPLEDIHYYVAKSARYFAEAIGGRDYQRVLADIFPACYEFSSHTELIAFLEKAVEFACMKDISSKLTVLKGYRGRISYIGAEACLNAYCCLLSDAIRTAGDKHLEFYSSIPYYRQEYGDVFNRVAYTKRPGGHAASDFNYYIERDDYLEALRVRGFPLLNVFEYDAMPYDLDVFFADSLGGGSYFFMLKDRFVLLINREIDGTMVMTKVENKTFLSRFEDAIEALDADKISYDAVELLDETADDPTFLEEFGGAGARSYVSSYFLGYLLSDKDIPEPQRDTPASAMAIRLLAGVRSNDAAVISVGSAVRDFLTSGEIQVPFCGRISIDEDERMPFLRRFTEHLSTDVGESKYWVLDKQLPRFTLISGENRSIIYGYNEVRKQEKFFIVDSPIIGDLVREGFLSGQYGSPIDERYWERYLIDLSDGYCALIPEDRAKYRSH